MEFNIVKCGVNIIVAAHEEYTGKVSFAVSVISYFSILANLGIPTYGIRACAALRDDREKLTRCAQEIYLISVVTTLLSLAAYCLVVRAVPAYYAQRKLYAILGLYLVVNSLGAEWLYKGLEQYSYIAGRTLVLGW